MIAESEANLRHKHQSVQDTSLHPKIQKGIIPVPIIITEPALGGFGGGLALGYLHSNRHSIRPNTPPTISGIAGGVTSNGTWFAGLGHSHSFVNDHIRYMGGMAYTDVRITFYDNNSVLFGSIPFNVIMNSWGTVQKLLFRIKESNMFLGPSYIFINSKIRLNENTDHPLLDSLINSIEQTSNLGMLGLEFNYDSRDNFLSPNKGLYIGGKYHYNASFLGGDQDFGKTEIFGKVYLQVSNQVFGAFRIDGQFIGEEAPFYARPYIYLRGVPAARYQGNQVMVVETQWRWLFYRNLSIVGFTGTGKALDNFDEFGSAEWIYNYGGGARFALKRLFDMRMGVDVAWSNEDFAWYISVGSSF